MVVGGGGAFAKTCLLVCVQVGCTCLSESDRGSQFLNPAIAQAENFLIRLRTANFASCAGTFTFCLEETRPDSMLVGAGIYECL